MPDVPSQVTDAFGLAGGIVIFALAAAVVILWRQNSRLQEERIADAKAFNDMLTNQTASVIETMSAMTATVRELSYEVRRRD